MRRQTPHPLDHLGYLAERPFGDLQHLDALLNIATALGHRVNIGVDTIGQRQTGRIIAGAIDPHTRRGLFNLSACITEVGLHIAVNMLEIDVVIKCCWHRASSMLSEKEQCSLFSKAHTNG